MSAAALPIVFEAVLRALIAACVLGAGLRLLRVRNVPAQKVAWGLVLLAALAMPLLMRWQRLPAWAAVKVPAIAWTRTAHVAPASATAASIPVPLLHEPAAIRQPRAVTDDHFDAPGISDSDFPALPSATPEIRFAPAPTAVAPAGKPVVKSSFARLIAFSWLLYLVVGAALLLRLLVGLAASLRLWVEAEPVSRLTATRIPHGLAVRASRKIASPVNIASGVLLPAEFASWGDEKLRVVLAHEEAHIRQRDFYLQLLAGFYTALTWFSPLGWWLRRKLSELGEAISDRAGLEAAASPTAYAELLLEFAALPRPTVSGVAMANSTNLPQRIERVLNESSFRQTFAGGRRALAMLLAPAVLIVATGLVRVEAAAKAGPGDSSQMAKPSPERPTSQAALTGQSDVEAAPLRDSVAAPAAQAMPAPREAAPVPQTPAAPPQQDPAPMPSPSPQAPQSSPAPQADQEPQAPAVPQSPRAPKAMEGSQEPQPHMAPFGPFVYLNRDMLGDWYEIIGDPAIKSRFRGEPSSDCMSADVKASASVHGQILFICHEGKPYIIDDPAIMAQIDTMDRALQDQDQQMRVMGQQLREQMRDASQRAREASLKANAEIAAPDISKEMAELNAAVAALQAKQGGTVTREQLNDLQRKIGDVQRRVIDAEFKDRVKLDMSRFNAEQDKFGAEMGQMGAEIGRVAKENDQKIRAIIDEGLKDGKARPAN
jgi:beta-lactamase regulating signal transducer with metallopeptidase domain